MISRLWKYRHRITNTTLSKKILRYFLNICIEQRIKNYFIPELITIFVVSIPINLICNQAFAKNLEISFPVFKGYTLQNWSIQSPVETVYNDGPNCSIGYSTLKIQKGVTIDFQTKTEFLKYVKSRLPHHDDCTWSINASELPITYAPVGVPYEHNKFKPSYFISAYCKNASEAIDSYFNGISPIYLCPENNRYHYDAGCVPIDDENCPGDIVARSLNTNIDMLKEQGHVGIVIDGVSDDRKYLVPYVIEVLDEPGVLKINTLDDFYNKVPGGYWGEKYGTPDNPTLSQEQFFNYLLPELIQFLEDLDAGLPITYTKTWSWYRGGYKQVYVFNEKNNKFQKANVLLGAKFRCDTFVRYFYERIPNIKLDTTPFITPRILFINLLNTRNGQEPNLDYTPYVAYTPYKLAKTPNEIEEWIQNSLKADLLDNKLDKITYQYILDNTISNKRKYEFFSNLLNKNLNSEQKTNYILDLIDEEKNLDFTDELIQLIKNTDSSVIKNKLIIILNRMTVFESEIQIANLTQNDINNILKIKKILLDYSKENHLIRQTRAISKFKNLFKSMNNSPYAAVID